MTDAWMSRLRSSWMLLPILLLAAGYLSLWSQINGLGQGVPLGKIKVEQLQVVNPAGRSVVVLTVNDDGAGLIGWSDGDGNVRGGLIGGPESGSIHLTSGPQGRTELVSLGIDESGSGMVTVRAADLRGFVSMTSMHDNPALVLSNTMTESAIVLGYPEDTNREPVVELFGPDMESRVLLTTRGGEGRVSVAGQDGSTNLVRPYRH